MPCVLAGPDEEAAWLAGEADGLLGPLRRRAHGRRAGQPRRQQGRGRGRRAARRRRRRPSPHSSAWTPDGPPSGRVPSLNEGQLVLIVGVLLAAGLAASLAAGRLRVPGLVLVLRLGMAIGSDGLEPDRLRRLRAGAPGRRRRARLHPLRGRPVVGLRRDPAGARDVDRAGHARHARHGGADRRPGGAAVRPRPARGAAARLDGGRHRRRRRSSPCCADRRCAASSRARWRASRASTTRSRSCSSSAASRRSSTTDFGLEDALLLVVQRALDRLRRRARRRRPRRALPAPRDAAVGRSVSRSPRSPPAALAFGAALTLHGSGFLAVFLAGLVLGTASTPARRTIVTFHEGLALGRPARPLPGARAARVPGAARRRSSPRAPRSPS